jgi:capsular exopolysaccharide synthesis family protein
VRPAEGKSRTAANLAVALAGAEKQVLLIDADMRKPSQHKIFDKPMHPGLSGVLIASAQAGAPMVHAGHTTEFTGLGLMTCGTILPNPSELLTSRRSAGVLRALESQYDIVVIDTPARRGRDRRRVGRGQRLGDHPGG